MQNLVYLDTIRDDSGRFEEAVGILSEVAHNFVRTDCWLVKSGGVGDVVNVQGGCN